MKFTAFVLATAAISASAQISPFNQFAQPFGVNNAGVNGINNGVAFQPYGAQQPIGYGIQQPYPIAVPQVVDPLAWERDCTWVNSIGFRQSLSLGTCGSLSCTTTQPNGNGGGHARNGYKATTNNLKVGYQVWGSVINRAGRVCAVAYTGSDITQQFPYGRILSMKLANTANSLSLPNRAAPSHIRHSYPNNNRGLIMNGAGNPEYGGNIDLRRTNNDVELDENAQNQFSFTAPGGNTVVPNAAATYAAGGAAPLGPTITAPTRQYGANVNTVNNQWAVPGPIQGTVNAANGAVTALFAPGQGYFAESQWFGFTLPAEQFNPGNVDVHYQGATSNYGEACGTTRQDPMCMQKPGGFTYQAGGLPLYDQQGVLRGAIGVAGDNDCTNHAIAWKTREQMRLQYTPCSTANERNDNVNALNGASPAAAFVAALASNEEVHWAGKKAEDNVIFSLREQYLFPECQNKIRMFATSNPTLASTFGASSCAK